MAGEGFKIADGYLDIDADDSKAQRKLTGFFRSADGRLRDLKGRFAREGGQFGEQFADNAERGVDERGRRFQLRGMLGRLGALGQMAGGLFANKFFGAGFAGAAALPGTINAVAGALSGLAQIGGALGALAPAGILTLVAGIAGLKVAMSGLGDVFKAGLSGDMGAFGEAMKKLGPNTQAAVKEILGLKDAATALRRTVQEDFFAPLVGQIRPLAQLYLPQITELLSDFSNRLGGAARDIGTWLRLPEVFQRMSLMFDMLGQTAAYLEPILANIVRAFFTLAQVGSTFLPGFAEGLAGVTNQFATWLEMMAQTGGLQEFISGGLSLLGDLLFALKDIWGIFQAINSAAPATASVFGIIGTAIHDLSEFLNSAAGQAGLGALLQGFAVLGQILKDLLVGAGPGLAAFLGGLLMGLQALAPAAKPVGDALSAILKAVAPLLPMLGQELAVILTFLATALQVVAEELAPFIALWSHLAVQILPKLLPVIQQLAANAFPVIAAAAAEITNAFLPLIPVLVELADTIIAQIMPFLPQFAQVLASLVPIIGQVATLIAAALLDAIRELAPHLPEMIRVWAEFALILFQLLPIIVQLLPPAIMLFSWFLKAVFWVMDLLFALNGLPAAIGGAATAFWGWLGGVGAAIGGFFANLGQWFASLPSQIWGFLQTIPGLIHSIFSDALNRAAYAVGFGIGVVIGYFTNLPPRIWAFLQTIPPMLADAFSRAWNSAVSATISGFGSVMSFFSSLASRISGAIMSIPGLLGSIFSNAWRQASNSTSSGFNSVMGWFRNLGPSIRGVLADAGSWLYNAGRAIVQGLINGIMSMVNAVRNAASSLLRGIRDALPGSPVKEGPLTVLNRGYAGRRIAEMIAEGMEAGIPRVNSAFRDGVSGAMPSAVADASGASNAGGTRHYVIQIGDTAFAELVVNALSGEPAAVAAITDEGRRRRSFSYPSRARL